MCFDFGLKFWLPKKVKGKKRIKESGVGFFFFFFFGPYVDVAF